MQMPLVRESLPQHLLMSGIQSPQQHPHPLSTLNHTYGLMIHLWTACCHKCNSPKRPGPGVVQKSSRRLPSTQTSCKLTGQTAPIPISACCLNLQAP